jgi:hypothetical protein
MSDQLVTLDKTMLGVIRTQRNCYKRYRRENELSSAQIIVIHFLVRGHTDQEAADAAHVHRTTVTRWRLYHPTFQTELHRQREALWLNNLDRLRALMTRALDTLQRQLSSNSERAAYRAAASLLRVAARFGPPSGPTDEYHLLKEFYLAEHRETERYENQMNWPIPKENLDALREYLILKSHNLPLEPPPDPHQPSRPPDNGATP